MTDDEEAGGRREKTLIELKADMKIVPFGSSGTVFTNFRFLTSACNFRAKPQREYNNWPKQIFYACQNCSLLLLIDIMPKYGFVNLGKFWFWYLGLE